MWGSCFAGNIRQISVNNGMDGAELWWNQSHESEYLTLWGDMFGRRIVPGKYTIRHPRIDRCVRRIWLRFENMISQCPPIISFEPEGFHLFQNCPGDGVQPGSICRVCSSPWCRRMVEKLCWTHTKFRTLSGDRFGRSIVDCIQTVSSRICWSYYITVYRKLRLAAFVSQLGFYTPKWNSLRTGKSSKSRNSNLIVLHIVLIVFYQLQYDFSQKGAKGHRRIAPWAD